MVSRGQNFALGQVDVLLAAGDNKNGLLAADWSLDVGVSLGAQGLDLATCNKKIISVT